MSLAQRGRRRTLGAAAVLAPMAVAVLGGAPTPVAAAAVRAAGCVPRLLVLSALPAEIDPLLARATLTGPPVVVDGRVFHPGRLAGHDVVVALSGIGLVNAGRTAQAAFDRFRCGTRQGIDGVVFSGVAGGGYIGDVTVPRRWTRDGATWREVDPSMLATARRVAGTVTPRLERSTPVGDPACTCQNPDLVRTVRVTHAPEVVAGGDGLSSDPFGGRAFPCVPSGGDVFGCEPCRAQTRSPSEVPRFASGILPFLGPGFFLGYFQPSPPPPGRFDAQDMETAAVADVASRYRTPFIAFRAVSDGKGDPLHLPGFPFQFFVYRQLAADNAATTAVAFLRAWTEAPASGVDTTPNGAHPVSTTTAVAAARGAALAALPDTAPPAPHPLVAVVLVLSLTAMLSRRART